MKAIESELDYIKSIGVNTIRLSPIFDSEFLDGGYDITDFYKVDTRYIPAPDTPIVGELPFS